MNSDINHDFRTVFYDYEILELNKHFKECRDILSRISKRCDRRQNVQISPTLYQYAEKLHILNSCPQDFYNFSMDDVRICIFKYCSRFSVSVCGFDFPKVSEFKCVQRISFTKLYGDFDSIDEAIPLFIDIVCYYLYEVKKVDELSI